VILVKNRRFSPTPPLFDGPVGVTPMEFRPDLWQQKTIESLCCRMVLFARSYSLAVLVQYRRVSGGQTDEQTERQTDTRRQHISR